MIKRIRIDCEDCKCTDCARLECKEEICAECNGYVTTETNWDCFEKGDNNDTA